MKLYECALTQLNMLADQTKSNLFLHTLYLMCNMQIMRAPHIEYYCG